MKSVLFAAALLAAPLAACATAASEAAPKPAPVQIALTFDDLPAHAALPPGATRVQVAEQLIAELKAAGAPQVYGFINGVQLEREPASEPVLGLWRAAGFPLGNHTWSHMALSKNPLEAWEAEVARNEPLLRQHMPEGGWTWLRYPFLDEGDTPEKRDGARVFLAQHGYRIASVTMSFDDWAFNDPYARCAAKGDQGAIAQLEATYLTWAADALAYSRQLSNSLYGRDIPYVLLMHEGAFDARMLPRLIAYYRSQGVEFVTLDEAERHPFYAADYEPKAGPATTLENALRAKGRQPPPRSWNPGDLDRLCR